MSALGRPEMGTWLEAEDFKAGSVEYVTPLPRIQETFALVTSMAGAIDRSGVGGHPIRKRLQTHNNTNVYTTPTP